jgi:alkyl sulfatase BDS1-like metallo-beta-lactamase superfamily hydrolase
MPWKLRRSFPFTAALLLMLAGSAAAAERAEKEPLVRANPRLIQHSNFFPRTVYDLQTLDACREKAAPLAYKAYSAVGFNLANMIVLVGPDNGLVIVDTLGSDLSAKIALEAIRVKAGLKADKDGKLPIKAIIYTHNHIDHTAGVQGSLALADRPVCKAENPNDAGEDGTYIGRQDCVEVISQEKVVDSVVNTATVVGEMINPRSSYMYGTWIGVNRINDGIGLEVNEGNVSFQMPSRTFSNELLLTAAGINMKLIYVPSETDDELAVFLPDGMNQMYREQGSAASSPAPAGDGWGGAGMLLSAEVIQGPSYPNLYSLRGTSYRNPAQWFRSVDKLRTFDSWSMVPAHGVPICGEEDIRIVLRNFRDAIQFTHDQAVRLLNEGKTIEELASQIHMPDYLVNDLRRMKPPIPDVNTEDYLTPFYGSVPQAVREIYFGYLGWFQADPVALQATPPRELSVKMVQMMGGAGKVVGTAEAALAEGSRLVAEGLAKDNEELQRRGNAHLQWAAELTTEVVRAELESQGRPREICKDLLAKFDHSTPWDQCLKDRRTGVTRDPKPVCTGSDSYCRAREVKASAFLTMAELPTNPNWRNWYISSAQELCGLFHEVPPVVGGLVSSDIVTALPPAAWVNAWTMRLKAEKTAPLGPDATCGEGSGVHDSLGFLFTGDDRVAHPTQAYALHIRCAIAAFEAIEQPVSEAKLETFAHVNTVVAMTYGGWTKLLAAMDESVACREKDPFRIALERALADGDVRILKGSRESAKRFFVEYFDPPQLTFQSLTLR